MFQPGEEGHHGARYMLDEGLLDVPDARRRHAVAGHRRVRPAHHVVAAVGLAEHPAAARSWRRPTRCSSTVTGKGGHASEPHRALDPIPVACEIVQALQMMVTRTVDVFDPAVVTVGQIAAGTTNNIIPETAQIEGTIRAVSETTRAKVHDGIRRVADGIAAAHGCRRRGRRSSAGYPVTVNDDVVRRPRARRGRRRRRRRQGRAPAAPGDGRRGLQLRAAAGARGDDVPRRHATSTATRRPPRRTTPTGSCSTSRRWPPASRSTPPSPSITSPEPSVSPHKSPGTCAVTQNRDLAG